MPDKPKKELEQTNWLTPAFKEESNQMITIINLLEKEVKKITNGNHFWKNNILGQEYY